MVMPPLVESVPVIVRPPEPLVPRPAQSSVSPPVTVSVPAVIRTAPEVTDEPRDTVPPVMPTVPKFGVPVAFQVTPAPPVKMIPLVAAVTPVLLFVIPPAPIWMPPPVETVSVAPATRRAPAFEPDDPSIRPADTMLPLLAVLSVPVWSVIEAAWSVFVPAPSATVFPAPGLTVTAPYALPATPDQWEVPAKAPNVSEPAPDD